MNRFSSTTGTDALRAVPRASAHRTDLVAA